MHAERSAMTDGNHRDRKSTGPRQGDEERDSNPDPTPYHNPNPSALQWPMAITVTGDTRDREKGLRREIACMPSALQWLMVRVEIRVSLAP